MFNHGLHHITLADWHTFRKQFSPYLFEAIIDRIKINMAEWFVPLARGVAIASPYLLGSAGYRPGMYRPRHWRKNSCNVYQHDIGHENILLVRRTGSLDLWSIELWHSARPYQRSDQVLVFVFGSTPILTRGPQSAMWLAMHCYANGPPSGLRWITACPRNYPAIVELARERRMLEALAQGNAVTEALLLGAP
jgi:hypothetical protein